MIIVVIVQKKNFFGGNVKISLLFNIHYIINQFFFK